MTETTPGFVADLRDELVAAAQRKIDKRRRRQRRTLHGLAAFAAIVFTASILQLTERPSDAGVLDVTRSNGVITFNLKSERASTAQIASELHRYGVDATITEVPVSSSGVGKFVSLVHETEIATPAVGQSSTYFQQFTLAEKDQQHIDLQYGRTAQPNELYVKRVNAYEPGELLHCTKTLGRTVRDAITALQKRNLDVQWAELGGAEIPAITQPTFQAYFIGAATSERPNAVIVYVSAEPIPFVGNTTDCA